MKTFDELINKMVVIGDPKKPFSEEEARFYNEKIQTNLDELKSKYFQLIEEIKSNPKFQVILSHQLQILGSCFLALGVEMNRFKDEFQAMIVLYIMIGLEMNSFDFEEKENDKEEKVN